MADTAEILQSMKLKATFVWPNRTRCSNMANIRNGFSLVVQMFGSGLVKIWVSFKPGLKLFLTDVGGPRLWGEYGHKMMHASVVQTDIGFYFIVATS